ncbi:UDP-glucose 4-epimerase GalE [uncultured Aurantimicrobium sp.]|uniref:UDP-glucose 4-epimerase GalE n=1 Tax=uncultured Aurantimicrobium sp. TaxID=1705357 RepID=UPI00260A3A0E|nr:UDP-glucose 4-epimerase GalE [uncultured Aurantimicrobium sp.]
MSRWLITGGAGYIGSHAVREFLEAGYDVTVLDDLSSGHREFLHPDARFVEGSLLDNDALATALEGVTGVVHFGGYKYAGESVKRPMHTYEQNVTGTVRLLEACNNAGVELFVFSSSAAVYGTPDVAQVTEETPTRPESPYGETKLIGEWLLKDAQKACGLKHTSLRYFNVIGSGDISLRDTSPHNLIPLVFAALKAGKTPSINGNDYPTPDGTCVRDYVDVSDIAKAHVAAAGRLESGLPVEPVYNLGAGEGVSVLQIMQTVSEVTGHDFEPGINPRRPGDPALIVADGSLAARDLKWENRADLAGTIKNAWLAELESR